eukprot:4261990-Pleurochrysis_carterae.AAC.2
MKFEQSPRENAIRDRKRGTRRSYAAMSKLLGRELTELEHTRVHLGFQAPSQYNARSCRREGGESRTTETEK